MADWVTAQSADGPKVAAWIAKNIPGINHIDDPNAMRRVSDWRAGARADIHAIDRILTRHLLHLQDLPDEVWSEAPARRPGQGQMKRPAKPRGPARTVLEPKLCEHCGETIPFVRESGTRVSPRHYRRARFCTRACAQRAMRHWRNFELAA